MMKEKKDRKKIFLFMFRTLSLIIILICLYSLYNWHIENEENSELIDDIRSQIIIPDITTVTDEKNLSDMSSNSSLDTSANGSSDASLDTSSNSSSDTSANSSSNTLVDFSNLLSMNPDTVAWIKVNNTAIDFPVVKSQDNDYYLKHNFKNQYNSAGWIFADCRNKFDDTDKNIIIYGHNRRDGSMFSTLKNTISESWYTNPNNSQIPLYTVSGTYTYQIFSIYAILAQNFDNSVEFSSDEEFKNYIDDICSKSVYNFNVDVSSDDSILTLYTCENNTKYRVILHAKKITY